MYAAQAGSEVHPMQVVDGALQARDVDRGSPPSPFVLTTNIFPINAEVKNRLGLPWGGILQPYVALDSFLSRGKREVRENDQEALYKCSGARRSVMNPFVRRTCRSGGNSAVCGMNLKFPTILLGLPSL